MAIDAISSNGLGTSGIGITPPQSKSNTSSQNTVDTVIAPSTSNTDSQVTATDKKPEAVSVGKTDEKNSVAKAEDSYTKKLLKEEEEKKKRRRDEEEEKSKTEEQKKEETQKLVEELNKKMNQFGSSIKFGVNDKSNSLAVSVMDGKDNTSLRNISSTEASKLADRMSYVLGVLFDQKA